MFKKILIVLFVIIGAILGYATTKPNEFRIERSLAINASADKIFPYINDLREWEKWSPYEKLDPEMKHTYSGAEKGKGAIYEWDGNNSVGSGRMEIVTVAAPRQIDIKIGFKKPMEASNMAAFTLHGNNQSTTVTWAMEGKNNYFSKVMCVFINMDKLVGKDFESGLQNLKIVVES